MIKKIIPLIVLFLSFCLIVGGIFSGEAESVIEKATKVCMECIGIG